MTTDSSIVYINMRKKFSHFKVMERKAMLFEPFFRSFPGLFLSRAVEDYHVPLGMKFLNRCESAPMNL